MKTYTTVQGDMWDSIAYKQMGNCRYTDILMNANIRLHETYIFDAGTVLVIPDVPVSANSSLPPWKRVIA